MRYSRLLVICIGIAICFQTSTTSGKADGPTMKKTGDIVIYQDERFYSAFPSIVVRANGEILCAFRRAPDRRKLWGASVATHTDANSYLVLVRSRDGGKTWTKDPELIHAHPFGGSQDPCMVQLDDGSIVCSSYAWALIPTEGANKVQNMLSHPPYAFLGGYIMRSSDGGKSWAGPFTPPSLPDTSVINALGDPLPAYNRGSMIQRSDGKLYWAVAWPDRLDNVRTSVHLLVSSDRGETWSYSCPIASDDKISFNETSLIETAKGDLVAFMRTADMGGKAAVARSTDGGKSFHRWEDGGFVGHPFHAVCLPDNRVFLVYGYRQPPFGIRARLLDPDCANLSETEEFVIRDDGGNGDIGYPWAAILPEGEILVAYYFNKDDGTRHIAGSLISIE